jgi:hypothetical protein
MRADVEELGWVVSLLCETRATQENQWRETRRFGEDGGRLPMIFVAPGVVVWVSVWRVRVLGVDVGCCGQDSV